MAPDRRPAPDIGYSPQQAADLVAYVGEMYGPIDWHCIENPVVQALVAGVPDEVLNEAAERGLVGAVPLVARVRGELQAAHEWLRWILNALALAVLASEFDRADSLWLILQAALARVRYADGRLVEEVQIATATDALVLALDAGGLAD